MSVSTCDDRFVHSGVGIEQTHRDVEQVRQVATRSSARGDGQAFTANVGSTSKKNKRASPREARELIGETTGVSENGHPCRMLDLDRPSGCGENIVSERLLISSFAKTEETSTGTRRTELLRCGLVEDDSGWPQAVRLAHSQSQIPPVSHLDLREFRIDTVVSNQLGL
jgi:hypothetical protein